MIIWMILFIFSVSLIFFTAKRKFSRGWIKSLAILFEIFLALFIGFRIFFPFLPVSKPTGPQKVQVDRLYYRHETKFPAMATEGKDREIPVHVYHPEKMKKGTHPLLLFSHGASGVGRSNETLFYELASRGCLVFSLDHPHDSFFCTLSSGKKIFVDQAFLKEAMSTQGGGDLQKDWDQLNRWVDPRIEDINFVLDKILDGNVDNAYEDKIDPKRIILAGHSLGGAAALAIGRQRPQDVQALVILEAPFAKDIQGIKDGKYVFNEETYPRPILHIYSDALWGKMDTITTYALNLQMIKARDPHFVNQHIQGVGHLGLTDMSLVSPLLTNKIDGGLDKRKAPEPLLEINQMVLDFLKDQNLLELK